MFDAFFSYASRDHAVVEQVARALTDRGLRIFLDRWYLAAGQPWPKELEARLADCRAVAVFIGADGLGPWQQRERDLALDRQAHEPGFPVIPVLLNRIDPALGFLQLNTWIDLTRSADDPDALATLVAAIRGEPPGPPALDHSAALRSSICPYRGLRPFREEDEGFFFGRGKFSDDLTEAVLQQPFVAVIGASGSGKSSVVRAGLIPRLRRGADGKIWDAVTFVPGDQPLVNLSDALLPLLEPELSEVDRLAEKVKLANHLATGTIALRDVAARILAKQPGTDRLLLFVDQWEEVYTLCDDANERLAFIGQHLQACGDAVRVVMTMRGDFTGKALENRELSDRLQNGFVTIGPMTRDELSETIIAPAEKMNLQFEPGLPEIVLDELGDEPGGLPLLEFLLEGLWANRRGNLLTHETYVRLGRVSGAIAHRAEAIFEGALTEPEREAVQRLLLRMVRPGEGVEDTRRRAALPGADALAQATIKKLADERLVVVNRGDGSSGTVTVEVAHEALIQRWQRFRGWIEEDREFLRTRERIATLAGSWEKDDRAADRLLSPGRPLAEGEDLLATHRSEIEPLVIEYIEASALAARTAERQERQRTRTFMASMTAIALIAVAFGGVAWWQRGEAEAQRQAADRHAAVADQQARQARAGELVTRARRLFEELPGHNAAAALLALESLRLGGGGEAQGLISEILALTPRHVQDMPHIPAYSQIAQSPDAKMTYVWTHEGNTSSSGGPDYGAAVALVIDPDTGEVKARVAHEGAVRPALSPGGRWLAVGGFGRRLKVIDVNTGKTVIDEPRMVLTVPIFAPDGKTLYVANADGVIETRVVPTWEKVSSTVFLDRKQEWGRLDLRISQSVDGDRLLIRLPYGAWLGPPGGPFSPLPDLDKWTDDAAFDPTGTHIVTITGSSRAQIRGGKTGAVITETRNAWGIETAWAFDKDQGLLAIGDEYGIVEVWDTESGERHLELDHDKKAVRSVLFAPDGSQVIAFYASGAVRGFDTLSGEKLFEWVSAEPISDGVVESAGKGLYLAVGKGEIRKVDPETGDGEFLFRPEESPVFGLSSLKQDAESRLLVGALSTGLSYSWTDLRAYSSASGQEIWHQAINGNVHSVSVRPDGRELAATRRHVLTLRDASDGLPRHEIPVSAYSDGVHFTADGTRLVVVGADNVHVIDPRTGEVLFGIGEPGGVDGIVVLQDRRTVLTHSHEGAIRAWDAITGDEIWSRDNPFYAYFSGDGRRYVVRSADGQFVSETRSGKIVANLPNPSTPYWRTYLSFSGDRLVTASGPTADPLTGARFMEIALWDVDTATKLRTLRTSPIPPVIYFSPDQVVFIQDSRTEFIALDSVTGETLWEKPYERDWVMNFDAPALVNDAPIIIPRNTETTLLDPRTGIDVGRLPFPIGRLWASPDLAHALVTLTRQPGEKGPQVAMVHLASGRQVWTADVSLASEGVIDAVHFIDDGRRILVLLGGSEDSDAFLKVVDASDGEVLSTLRSESTVRAFEPLADPDLIVTYDWADTARVWRLSTGEELRRVAHGFSARDADVAGAANRAVTRQEGSLRVWDLESGEQISRRITRGDVEEAILDPAGSLVAYVLGREQGTIGGHRFQAIFLWDVENEDAVRRIPIEGRPRHLVFDPDGRRLAARVGDQEIRIWDVASLRLLATLRAAPDGKFASERPRFSDDGTFFSAHQSASSRGQHKGHLGIWKLDDQGRAVEAARVDGAFRWIHSTDGTLVTGGHRGGRRWDVGSGSTEKVAFPGVRTCCRDVVGADRWIEDWGYDRVRVLDVGTAEVRAFPHSHDADSLSASAYSSNMAHVYLAERELRDGERIPGSVRLVSFADGGTLATSRPAITVSEILPLLDRQGALLLGTPGGVIVRGRYEHAYLWRPSDGRMQHLNGDNPVNTVEISPDGQTIVLGEALEESRDNRSFVRGEPRLTIWDARNGSLVQTIPYEQPPQDIAFSQDGKSMVVRDGDGFILYDTATWVEIRRDEGQFGFTSGRIGMIGNDWIALPEKDRLRLISIGSDDEIVLDHSATEPTVFPSADASIFATTDQYLLRVWEITEDATAGASRTGGTTVRLLATYPKPKTSNPLFAGPENNLYVGAENAVHRLLYRADDIEAEVCRRMGRGLSDEEIKTYFPADMPANPCALK